jgi:hypothetical protein
MDIAYSYELTKTSYQVLREAGYIPITDRKTGKQSYVFKITGNRYPRYHVYVEDERDDFLKLHMHLDHREHGFGERLHDTEYKGEKVEAEGQRLQRWLAHFTVKEEEADSSDQQPKDDRGFLSKLFG